MRTKKVKVKSNIPRSPVKYKQDTGVKPNFKDEVKDSLMTHRTHVLFKISLVVKPLDISRYGSRSGVRIQKNRSDFFEIITQNSYHWSDTTRITRKIKS